MADDLEDFREGDALTQEQLDALLSAAGEEEDAPAAEAWPSATEDVTPEPVVSPAGLGGGASPSPAGVVDLPSFDPPAGVASGGPVIGGLGRVRDIPLEVTVELGRTRLLIRDILDLGAGSIIELDKIAGEPVDLYANGLLVARGEVVVIDDNFGVRVTEIITAADRSQMKDSHALAA